MRAKRPNSYGTPHSAASNWFAESSFKTAQLSGRPTILHPSWYTFKFSDTWQLVINTGTTIVTFLMVFLIENTQIPRRLPKSGGAGQSHRALRLCMMVATNHIPSPSVVATMVTSAPITTAVHQAVVDRSDHPLSAAAFINRLNAERPSPRRSITSVNVQRLRNERFDMALDLGLRWSRMDRRRRKNCALAIQKAKATAEGALDGLAGFYR